MQVVSGTVHLLISLIYGVEYFYMALWLRYRIAYFKFDLISQVVILVTRIKFCHLELLVLLYYWSGPISDVRQFAGEKTQKTVYFVLKLSNHNMNVSGTCREDGVQIALKLVGEGIYKITLRVSGGGV